MNPFQAPDERKAILQWLRERVRIREQHGWEREALELLNVAEAISRGEHLESTP